MTRPSWTLALSIFPGQALDQSAKLCAAKVTLSAPKEKHLPGEGARLCLCCWPPPGQAKYLGNINPGGESKAAASSCTLLLITLLIICCLWQAGPRAMGQQQSFPCSFWHGTMELWCSPEAPPAAWGMVWGWQCTGWGGWQSRQGQAGALPRSFAVQQCWGKQEMGCRGLRAPAHPAGLSSPAALLSCLLTKVSFLVGTGKGAAWRGWWSDLMTAVRCWVLAQGSSEQCKEGAEGSAVSIPVPAATEAHGG